MRRTIHRGDAELRRNPRRKTFEGILSSCSPRFPLRLRVSAVNGNPILWIALLVSAATAQVAPSPKDLKYPPLRAIQVPEVTTAVLPNGMKLYLLEDHELPLVNGVALIRTGNLFDPREKIGLASLTGTVMRTGGTPDRTGEQLDQKLENIAASVEAGIGETSGTVSFQALKENLGDVLGVFKDVLTRPEFRPDKLDLAKSQARSAISRRNDQPADVAQREFTNILYGKNTPYGWEEQYATVDRITRADLRNFYNRYFFPANVTLAVWGDFDAAQMKAAIEKLFADWTVQQAAVPEFPKVTNPPAPGVYLAEKRDATQTFFALGHLGGELKDKDYPALEIMADILGGGFQSRLVARVRTKMGNAYDIGASWGANYDHPGLFQISGSTKSLSTVETLKAIQEELERIRTVEVSEEELKTARETALNSMVFAYDTRSKTLGRLLTYQYFGYPKDFIQQYQKALAAVTRADVLRVAKQYVKPAELTVVAAGNPVMFGQPLEALGGPVNKIGLTIPEASREAAETSEASLAKGRQLLLRAQQAAGGTEKLAAVKDYTEVADFQIDASAGGMKVTQTSRWIAPTFFRQDTLLPSGRVTAYSDGRIGWIATLQGQGMLAGAQLKQVKGDLFRVYFRLMLSDRIEGRTVNGTDSATVEITDATGELVRIEFDDTTGLPRRLSYLTAQAAGASILAEDILEDFREIEGVKVPHKITISHGGKKFADVTVTDYKLNSGLKQEDLNKKPI
jgi:zinc protease